jgi:heme/copper-type cytochrome/quinol oxidase subunit 3
MLATLAWLHERGDVSRERDEGIRAVAAYWHFVDALWVVIFSVVYVWPHL